MAVNYEHRIFKFNNSFTTLSTLHIDSVTKCYNDRKILNDIFLSLNTGEIIGLIGRNGSGKTTLLNIVFGTVKADHKFVKVDSKHIRNISDGRNLINYLPQNNFLPNNVKIKTLLKLFLQKEDYENILKNELILSLLDKRSHDLSGGERRIIEILLIVHSNAKFILLDEPFNSLSPIQRDYIVDYIKKLKSDKGFIITDHDYERVIDIADTLCFLSNGNLRLIRDKQDLQGLGYLS